MICPKCGKRIEDDSLFCMYCGNNITATASEVRSKPKSYTRGDIALIAATIFFVLLGVILGTSMLSENSESQKNGSANIQVQENHQSSALHTAAENSRPNNSVSQEYQNALTKGLSYARNLHMSKKGIYDQLTSSYGEGFSADAAQYAIDNMTDVDWNENALAKAQEYYTGMSMSKSAVYDQLTSEYGEQFTASEAQYAIDHLN